MLPVSILIVVLSTALIGIMLWFKSRRPADERKKPSVLSLIGLLMVIFSILLQENPVLQSIVMGIGVGMAVGGLILRLVKSN